LASGVRYDVNYWNLDLLNAAGKRHGGSQRELSPADPGRISKIAFLPNNRLVVLRSGGNRIYSLDFGPSAGFQNKVLWESSNAEQAVDMSVSGARMYLLFPEAGVLRILEPKIRGQDALNEESIEVDDVSPLTRIAVFRSVLGHDIVVLAPTASGGFCVLQQPQWIKRHSAFDLDKAIGNRNLGPELALGSDEVAQTVLIAEASRHRVFEFKPDAGTLSLVCGIGMAGVSPEGAPPEKCRLNKPIAVAVYRPLQHIPLDYLRTDSRQIVKSDKIRPRTIYIVNAGNATVVRWIEMPDSPLAVSQRNRRELFTLIGPVPEAGIGQRSDELLPRSIEAYSLAISDQGLLALGGAKRILILTPGTTSSEQVANKEAEVHRMEDT
jgi:hypothetical protein